MNLASLDASEDTGGWRLCRLTSSAPGDPGWEKATTSTPGACLTVSQVQLFHRLRHRCLCRCGWRRIGFVRPIVTRRVAAMPCTTWLAAVVRAPVSFQEKETGGFWRSDVCRKGEVAAVQRGRSIVCRNGQISRVGIHHSWGVTVRAAGR